VNIRITGLRSIPEIRPGDPLGAIIRAAAIDEGHALSGETVAVIAHKIVSKAEGAVVDMRTIRPGPLAGQWASQWGKDPRLIELILAQAKRIVRMDRGVIIAETRHGFIAANAGVDRSNASSDHEAILLPSDPDASAALLQEQIGCGAVIVSDTFGRPWREGLVNVAIGVAGFDPLEDLRGSCDRAGFTLQGTIVALADELAAAAGLAMPKADGIPVALIEGVPFERQDSSAQKLIRPPESDLFR
jgi:coenzyme F420-0:L-glutamate ligase/coenzyme F420-1:gamma-L-glutamate ligase